MLSLNRTTQVGPQFNYIIAHHFKVGHLGLDYPLSFSHTDCNDYHCFDPSVDKTASARVISAPVCLHFSFLALLGGKFSLSCRHQLSNRTYTAWSLLSSVSPHRWTWVVAIGYTMYHHAFDVKQLRKRRIETGGRREEEGGTWVSCGVAQCSSSWVLRFAQWTRNIPPFIVSARCAHL